MGFYRQHVQWPMQCYDDLRSKVDIYVHMIKAGQSEWLYVTAIIYSRAPRPLLNHMCMYIHSTSHVQYYMYVYETVGSLCLLVTIETARVSSLTHTLFGTHTSDPHRPLKTLIKIYVGETWGKSSRSVCFSSAIWERISYCKVCLIFFIFPAWIQSRECFVF